MQAPFQVGAERNVMKTAGLYRNDLLTQQAGGTQTSSALRRLGWMEAAHQPLQWCSNYAGS